METPSSNHFWNHCGTGLWWV